MKSEHFHEEIQKYYKESQGWHPVSKVHQAPLAISMSQYDNITIQYRKKCKKFQEDIQKNQEGASGPFSNVMI